AEYLPDAVGRNVSQAAARAHHVFGAYRQQLRANQLDSAVSELPSDPDELSYVLSSTAVLTLRDQQALLEAPDTATRLRQFSQLMDTEIAAMRAVPSLPATEVARTSWSPN